MRNVDIIAAVLLVIGGLNLGLIGFFGYDLIGMLFGRVEILPRIIYAIIGIAAVFTIFQWRPIFRRWKR